MKVVNLVSWSGMEFSYAPGDEIELPDNVATARIALGLCREITDPTITPPSISKRPVKSKDGE